MTDDNLWSVSKDILREMYEAADPGLDFDDVVENPDEYPQDWFTQHTLPRERQKAIVDEHCEKHDLSKLERTTVTMTTIVDFGPSIPDGGDGGD